MNPRQLSTLRLIILVSLSSSFALAAAFQNLDFEAAQVVSPPSSPYNSVRTSEALPGWSVDWTPIGESENPAFGANAQFVQYNQTFNTGPTALLVGPERDDYYSGGRAPLPISGNYSAGGSIMQISQRGDIPAGQTGLIFETDDMPTMDSYSYLRVSINDSVLPLAPTGSPRQYRADITSWAGQEVVLTFSIGENLSVIDNISLVPEPSTWALAFGLPLLALGVLHRRRNESSPA
ncbi:MAG: hypothetical protein U1G08_18585 [Verrucomicrobiota bacterium]